MTPVAAAKKPAAKTAKKIVRRQNPVLARGVNAIAANSLARSNGRWKKGAKVTPKKTITKTLRKPKWYPTDYIPKPLPSAKTARNSVKTAKLRASITPGTVLILLSGRFRGKRVVFLKQLASGTLLVTGPYKVNGVPLRRVNQAFVIATSTKVDISDVKLPEINDAYFAKEKSSSKKDEEQFFAQSSKAAIVSEQRKKDQKAVDAALLKKIAAVPALKHYLNAKFSLTKKDSVHELKF
ncbi:60S ribosomal protein L6 [Thraustotheca clavata]|uniref:60S ribosomal protein L6 n=1 Tax=Thraustotheca clavata TaxID=74557 RepID=A0A1V9ZNF8_9STRA|nr:60S ribosomal protein L6 [Thraustotheca clavata]